MDRKGAEQIISFYDGLKEFEELKANPIEYQARLVEYVSKFRESVGNDDENIEPELLEIVKLVPLLENENYSEEQAREALMITFNDQIENIYQKASNIIQNPAHQKKEELELLALNLMFDTILEGNSGRTKWEEKKARIESEVKLWNGTQDGISQDGLNKIAEQAIDLGLELSIKNVKERHGKESKDVIQIEMGGNKYKMPVKFKSDNINGPTLGN